MFTSYEDEGARKTTIIEMKGHKFKVKPDAVFGFFSVDNANLPMKEELAGKYTSLEQAKVGISKYITKLEQEAQIKEAAEALAKETKKLDKESKETIEPPKEEKVTVKSVKQRANKED